MLGSEPVLERAEADAAGPTEGPSARVYQSLRDRPLTSIFIVCLILGIISVLVLPWVPSSDPYAWISWGQEAASHVVGTKIALSYHGGPSFKPFPVIFTSIFGLFGNAAPGLWLVVSRTASLLALVGIFRLGKRFGGTPAGILAAVALCFTQDAVFYMARGTSEPVVAAVTVWAIDRHLDGAKRAAYFLLFLGALNRPEFTPIMFLYGVWLWVTEPNTRTRAYAIVLLVLVPICWTFPPGIVNGDFLQAKNAAAGGKGSPGTAFAELKSSAGQLTDGILLLAAVGFGLAWVRRNRTLIWLGGAAVLWAVMVALITQFFYGLPRYLLPAAVIACVFAAVTVVWLAELAAARVPAGARTAVGIAVGTAVVAVTLPWSIDRGKVMVTQVQQATASGTYQHDLFTAVDRLGGKSKVFVCHLSYVAINHTAASMLAWKLKVDLFKVRPLMVSQGYVFVGPHVSDLGHPPPILSARVDNVRLVETSGAWRVYAVSRKVSSKYGQAGSLCPGHV
ncbi:MAG TPA: hypothetical protein VG410_02380 [Solirubrobacteraceae bacterium]|nr:hypothetical protein [Solirubrobacteraceae bacterium]